MGVKRKMDKQIHWFQFCLGPCMLAVDSQRCLTDEKCKVWGQKGNFEAIFVCIVGGFLF